MEKLAPVLRGSQYYANKVAANVLAVGHEGAPIAIASIGLLKRQLRSLEEVLASGGADSEAYTSVKQAYARVKQPLAELETYFQSLAGQESPSIGAELAGKLASSVKEDIAQLIKLAQELDARDSS